MARPSHVFDRGRGNIQASRYCETVFRIALVTRPDLIQVVQTFILRLQSFFRDTRILWMFGFQALLVFTWEWLIVKPLLCFLPHISHTLPIFFEPFHCL